MFLDVWLGCPLPWLSISQPTLLKSSSAFNHAGGRDLRAAGTPNFARGPASGVRWTAASGFVLQGLAGRRRRYSILIESKMRLRITEPADDLKTAGLAFADVHQRTTTFDHSQRRSAVVRRSPRPAPALAVLLAVGTLVMGAEGASQTISAPRSRGSCAKRGPADRRCAGRRHAGGPSIRRCQALSGRRKASLATLKADHTTGCAQPSSAGRPERWWAGVDSNHLPPC